ncbi:hypothetical protein BXZ70DRAFT_912955 [Cristinia sonorae]|uniref:Uncharacterized protein n=1 Tax=Cristinia sonorae TaxID=1940300 RepID=A0A8K0UY74_9AGAR|nr:hypothetical protein BXZ70DRAFT_912955 [Cristinia sonorae]
MDPRRSLPDVFPVELWGMIKAHLSPTDLITQIHFFDFAESISDAIYRDGHPQMAAFWEALCLRNGLGFLADEDASGGEDVPEVNWEKVARECARHAHNCEYPGCGKTRLEENFAAMTPFSHDYSSWDEIGRSNILLRSTNGRCRDDGFSINPLLEHIAFKETTDDYESPREAEEETLLRYSRFEEQSLKTSLLCKHPIARRSFATFPPTLGMRLIGDFFPGAMGLSICSQRGLTVDSYAKGIHEKLDVEFKLQRFGNCEISQSHQRVSQIVSSAALCGGGCPSHGIVFDPSRLFATIPHMQHHPGRVWSW